MLDTNPTNLPICHRCGTTGATYEISLPDVSSNGTVWKAMYCRECAMELNRFANDRFSYFPNTGNTDKPPKHKFTTYYCPYSLINRNPLSDGDKTKYGGEWSVYAKDAVDHDIASMEAENEALRKENAELRRIMRLATK